MRVICKECGKVLEVKKSTQGEYVCRACQLSKFCQKVTHKCPICGEMYGTFMLSGEPYHKTCGGEQCVSRARKGTNRLVEPKLSKRLTDIILQEVLVNGEDLVIQMLEIGRKELFRLEKARMFGSEDRYASHAPKEG